MSVSILTRVAIATTCAWAIACGGGKTPAPKAVPAAKEEEEAPSTPPSEATGPAADARRVGTSMRPDLRACYEASLAKDAKIEGFVKFTVKVGPQGDVTSAVPAGSTPLSAELVDCLEKRIERAHFAPPGPAGATIEIPMSFTPKKEGP
jgi:TonB family protein